jgi:hypothetical protein
MASAVQQFLETIRRSIRQYERTSARHAELKIEIQYHDQRYQGADIYQIPSSSRIRVSFKSVGSEPDSITTTCRPAFIAGSPTGAIQVSKGKHYISLQQFLHITFPVEEASVKLDPVWDWSVEETKFFNWTGLPVELKEQIVEHCMHQLLDRNIYLAALSRHRAKSGRGTELGPYEVTEQMGDWYSLLRVSKQVRAIVLRLCLRGSSSVAFKNGLCINAISYASFHECMERLGSHYQIVEGGSVPVDKETLTLAQQYSLFPKIYPRLSRYANMRHGIQRICLKMAFLDYFNFFKVTAGGFQHHQDYSLMTYEVFEQLPHLKEVIIRLPLRPGRGWKNDPRQSGPLLFHFESPCPRQLHRVIYERAAEVLAPYKSVKMLNFIDKGEESCFHSRRQAAIEALRFSDDELEELYEDVEGGIVLDETVDQAMPASITGEKEAVDSIDDEDGFFPPECRCLAACIYEPVFLRRY